MSSEKRAVQPYVVPIAVVILVVLFVFQQYGTHRVGGLFGPVMVVWFLTIATLGTIWIARAPKPSRLMRKSPPESIAARCTASPMA